MATCTTTSAIFSICTRPCTWTRRMKICLLEMFGFWCGNHTRTSHLSALLSKPLPIILFGIWKILSVKLYVSRMRCFRCYQGWFLGCTITLLWYVVHDEGCVMNIVSMCAFFQIGGCERSGLFHAFSEFMKHRLKVPTYVRHNRRFKVTFLSRDTEYRRVLNERQLLQALGTNTSYDVNRVCLLLRLTFPFMNHSNYIELLYRLYSIGITHLKINWKLFIILIFSWVCTEQDWHTWCFYQTGLQFLNCKQKKPYS